MGTFTGVWGTTSVPSEKREEFSKRMLTILREGGMMRMESVQLYGKRIYLLKSPEVDQTCLFHGWYNYFENFTWEDMSYNPETDELGSNKVGTAHFLRVVHAGYLLYEFYSETPCVAEIDGRIIPSAQTIGWFNYLFGTQYTNQRAANLWDLYVVLHKLFDDYNWDIHWLEKEVPVECWDHVGSLCYRYITTYKDLSDDKLCAPDSRFPFGKFVCELRKHIRAHYDLDDGRSKEEKLAELKEYLCVSTFKLPDDMASSEDPRIDLLWHLWVLPAPIVLKEIAEIYQMDFWSLYLEMEPKLPHRTGKHMPQPCPPETPVPTHVFLRCSNDERAYFWTPGGDVVFSEEMEAWLSALRCELENIQTEKEVLLLSDCFSETLITVLSDANQYYTNVMAFEEMFYEFLGRGKERPVQAAVILLSRMTEQYRDDPKVGTGLIRYYLAVLANKELRQLRFGF